MEIRQQYLQQYLHNIAVDQLSADYQSKGYSVTKEERIGAYKADLVAKKGDEVVIVEVKAGKMTPQKREQVAGLGDFVRTHKNYKFLIVVATPPKTKRIDIPNLDQLLFDYLVDNFPESLLELSSQTRISHVSDTIVHELAVSEDGSLVAKGNGTVEVELHYGSASDRSVTEEAFPLSFDITLKYNQNQELYIDNAENVDVDVSSFYE